MRILVAEDDAGLGAVLERGLREQGYVVDLVADGEAAAIYLRLYQYAAAVIDWRMPRLSGLDLVARLRRSGPVLLLAMFAGALVIGLRAQAPVEQARRRQLEFTADASHELRTPLSVIRAETDLALASPRKAADYRDTLLRIRGEGERLRLLVEDMLWLARFDSQPSRPDEGPTDLAAVARAGADRFRSVGPAVTADAAAAALVSAPPDWIDRLAGVLLDNACRYAGPDGQVRISVAATGSRVALTIEDSGPGIPAGQRPRLFDRFSRPAEPGAGTGLGLAIGDSVVRSTGGRWEIGDSPLGGARFTVSWRHSQSHRLPVSGAQPR